MIRTYLDHNATAPMKPGVRDAITAALDVVGNASSIHREGRRARALVEAARDEVALLINAERNSVFFTSGGTEANVTALAPENVVAISGLPASPSEVRCFVSAIEHPSVLCGGRFKDAQLTSIAVDGDGIIDVNALKTGIDRHLASSDGAPFLVSVMLANNETGAIQPVAEIATLVHELGGVIHSDCVQAAGKIAVDINALGVDFLALSAHKIGGPQGIGVLVLGRADRPFGAPLLTGGGQELKRRAGTENVAAIAGFGAAAKLAREGLGEMARIEALRDMAEAELSQSAPDVEIFSKKIARLPNTSCFAAPGLSAETALIALDLAGIAVSSGSACSSGKIVSSHVLAAMGANPEQIKAALRISLGGDSKKLDIERFIAAWRVLYERVRLDQAAA